MRAKISVALALLTVFFALSCSTIPPSQVQDKEIAEIEDYLVDFSKKVEGYRLINGSLPSDLDSDKFFAILDDYYKANRKPIQKVREFPVFVHPEGENYVLVVCSKDSVFSSYRDLGRTTDRVDFPYWREGKRVPCEKN